ncbi:MAG: hypothetical protein ACXACY_19080 [Candidatus Hodarchaeales archaeon]|jgi:hypothetical protein
MEKIRKSIVRVDFDIEKTIDEYMISDELPLDPPFKMYCRIPKLDFGGSFFSSTLAELDNSVTEPEEPLFLRAIGIHTIMDSLSICCLIVSVKDRDILKSLLPEQRYILGIHIVNLSRIFLMKCDPGSITFNEDKKFERRVFDEIKELMNREVEPGIFNNGMRE